MTGVVAPASGVGARIAGSTPAGGHSTPSERASLSESGSWAAPVELPEAPGGLTVGEDGVQPAGAGAA